MKTVFFLRHGKSDWDANFDHDHERPIATRGQKAARRMGRFLARTGQVPDAIVTSTAVRAKQTLALAMEAGDWDVPVRESRSLYEDGPVAVLAVIQAEAAAAQSLLLVGHEPTWSSSISRLIGGGAVRYPTAALARIDFEVASWREVQFGRGELQWLLPPKVLKEVF